MSTPSHPPRGADTDDDGTYPRLNVYIECIAPWRLRAQVALSLLGIAAQLIVPFGFDRDAVGRLRPHWRAGLVMRCGLTDAREAGPADEFSA